MKTATTTASDLIDSFIWKKVKPTYSQAHSLGLTSEQSCRNYVTRRWKDDVGPRGITIRTRKLWDAIKPALRVSPSEAIEGSLWKVSYSVTAAQISGELAHLQLEPGFQFYHALQSYDGFQILGWVIADNEAEAMMAAKVVLGPRAHSSGARCYREGVSTWAIAKAKNIELAAEIRKTAERAKQSLRVKEFEIENLECQVAFLEVGATFDCNISNPQE